jgi:hypothetical protein
VRSSRAPPRALRSAIGPPLRLRFANADAVAIVSVLASGVVGLAGVSSTVWIALAQRRWHSSEERAADLRTVLDRTGVDLSDTILALGEAHWAAEQASSKPEAKNELHEQGWAAERRSRASRASLRAAVKRVSVRRGAKDPIGLALDRVNLEIKELAEAVKDDLQGPMDKTRYEAAWNAVEKAELSFYSATEDVL